VPPLAEYTFAAQEIRIRTERTGLK